MLLDNLPVHKMISVRDFAAKMKIELIFNGTYSSTFNPIERLWAWSKRYFADHCIGDAPYHLQHRMRELVRESIE